MANSFSERKTRVFDLFVLIAISSVVLFPTLGQNRHWASREIRHAEIIREMAESGDYLIPKLLGKTYYDKPPVMHAAAAALTRIIGEPSMTITRTPSAVAGMLAVLAAYGIGILLFDRRSALLGAITLLGMPGYSFMAREARPDMILCAMILFSCFCLGMGMRKQVQKARTVYFLLAGLFAGVGVVTKGPYGVIFPVLFSVLVPFRNNDFIRPRIGWAGFSLGVLIAIAVWAVPVYFRDGGKYLHGVIFQADLDITKEESGKPLFWYFPYVFTLTLPLSLFLPLAIIDLRRRGYSAPLAVAGAIFIIISCVPQKRHHYLLPLDPFLALGIAASIVHHSRTSRLVRCSAWMLIPLSVIAIPLYFVAVQPYVHPYKKSQMFFAEEVFGITGPGAHVYTTCFYEEMAWVGRRYDRICKLGRDDSGAGRILSRAHAGSYLVIDDRDLKSLLKVAEPFPGELVLERKVGHNKMMLFRLGGEAFFEP